MEDLNFERTIIAKYRMIASNRILSGSAPGEELTIGDFIKKCQSRILYRYRNNFPRHINKDPSKV